METPGHKFHGNGSSPIPGAEFVVFSMKFMEFSSNPWDEERKKLSRNLRRLEKLIPPKKINMGSWDFLCRGIFPRDFLGIPSQDPLSHWEFHPIHSSIIPTPSPAPCGLIPMGRSLGSSPGAVFPGVSHRKIGKNRDGGREATMLPPLPNNRDHHCACAALPGQPETLKDPAHAQQTQPCISCLGRKRRLKIARMRSERSRASAVAWATRDAQRSSACAVNAPAHPSLPGCPRILTDSAHAQ